MNRLRGACLSIFLLQSPATHADCNLAFAPPEVQRVAIEHYYRSSRRDAPPPAWLRASSPKQREEESTNHDDAGSSVRQGDPTQPPSRGTIDPADHEEAAEVHRRL